MKSLSLSLGLCLLFFGLSPIFTQAQPLHIIAQSDRTRRIQFEGGEISTTFEDAVIK